MPDDQATLAAVADEAEQNAEQTDSKMSDAFDEAANEVESSETTAVETKTVEKKEDERPRGPDGKFIEKSEEEKSSEPAKEEEKKVEEKVELTAEQKAEEKAKSLEEDLTEPEDNVVNHLPADYKALATREMDKIQEWIKSQGKLIQKAAMSGDVDDAVAVLDLYKEAQGKIVDSKPVAIKGSQNKLMEQYGDVLVPMSDGSSKTLKQIVDEGYGEDVFAAAAALSRQIMKDDASPAPDNSKVLEAYEKRLAAAEQRANELAYWESVKEVHPDAKSIKKTEEFQTFLKNKPSMSKLAQSGNPDHAVMVLDAYKEIRSKQAKTESDKTSTQKKARKDTLLGESPTAKREVKQSKEIDDFDSGFEEGSKR